MAVIYKCDCCKKEYNEISDKILGGLTEVRWRFPHGNGIGYSFHLCHSCLAKYEKDIQAFKDYFLGRYFYGLDKELVLEEFSQLNSFKIKCKKSKKGVKNDRTENNTETR